VDNFFRVTEDAAGNPVYNHNNEVVTKDVFDQRRQTAKDQLEALKNRVTPGLDDDPTIQAMKERARANTERMRANKPIAKAKGGVVKASSRGDGIAQRGKTKGRMC
jgi:hypothetical protein